jgi:hypothetical protein
MSELPRDIEDADSSMQRELAVVFCDRLTQIIDRRPDVIRAGRGRTNDFAVKFDIHYTTAHRLLHEESLPPAALLCKIADTFDVTESWLLGRGESDVDTLVSDSAVKIHIFSPRSSSPPQFASMPASELPAGFDSARLIFNRTTTEFGSEVSVVVKLTAEAHEGKVHLLYDPVNARTYLRRINIIHSRNELLCVSTKNGTTETLKIEDLHFGDIESTTKTSVLGPVVAHIAYSFKGD